MFTSHVFPSGQLGLRGNSIRVGRTPSEVLPPVPASVNIEKRPVKYSGPCQLAHVQGENEQSKTQN